MQYGYKEIRELTDSDLLSANSQLRQMIVELNEKRANPKFQKKMENQPSPGINPAFQQLLDEVNAELDKRKIEHQ